MAIARDLMTASRVDGAVLAAGGSFARIDTPSELPPAAEVDLLFVDWSARGTDWGSAITSWRGPVAATAPRIILFGPHTDLEAHAAARAVGLGPMRARSTVFASLPEVIREFADG